MLIILGVVSMLVLAVIFSSFPPWDDHHEDENYIDWSVSVDGGNYLVQVHDIEPIYSRNVGFKLLDNNRLIETVDDPSGEDVRLEGELDDIAYDYNDYRLAELATWPGSTNGTQFYCDYPSGENNRTLYIVFIDADQDGYLCPGDYIWIRSILHDGPAKAGHTLRLSNEFDGEIYGDMILPDL